MKKTLDYPQTIHTIIIGSGFGGAVLACRLAQAGESVIVLERGKHHPPRAEYTNEPTADGTVIHHGHFQIDRGEGMNVIRGIGVGGGSLHYYGVRLRANTKIFETTRWPQEVTREVLNPYYDVVNRMIDAAPVSPHPVMGLPYKGEMFMKAANACKRCTRSAEWVPIAVHTSSEPIVSASGEQQTACVYCGECILGCPNSASFKGNVNARNLLTLNYLAVAQQHGALIFAEHHVQHIAKVGDGFEVTFSIYDANGELSKQTATLSAARVILSAGTLGTTEILLKSKDFLPITSTQLGQHFSGNGDFISAKTTGTGMNLQPTNGPAITAGAQFDTQNNSIYIEELGATPIFEEIFKLRKSSKLFAPDRHTLNYLGMGTDASNGELVLNKNGKVQVKWDPTESLPMYAEMLDTFKELSQQLNGTFKPPFGYKKDGTGLLTAHPLGGCIMGDSSETGVVNPKGEVYGVPNLFVADGSMVCSALATNPSYTISALAERVAYWMINGREMTANDL